MKNKESLVKSVHDQAQALFNAASYSEVISLVNKSSDRKIFSDEFILFVCKAHALMNQNREALSFFVRFIHLNPKVNLQCVVEDLISLNLFQCTLDLIQELLKKYPLSGYLRTKKSLAQLRMGSLDLSISTMLEKLKYGLIEDSDLNVLLEIKELSNEKKESSSYVDSLLNASSVRQVFERSIYPKTISLGRDCEFGMIQRIMGAEPVSLFRWGTLKFESFIELLNNDFLGFAADDSAYLEYENTVNFDEFWFFDRIYGAKIHTHFNTKNIELDDSYETLLDKSKKHFLYLARKLREDLEDGEKLFVYKSGSDMSHSDAFLLSKAMMRFGNNKLLVIMPLAADKNVHEVLSDNLHVGRVSKFWVGAKKDSIQVVEWNNIIQKSFKIFFNFH
jgi:hypothetical protein